MVSSKLSHNVPALIGAAKNRLTDLATLDAKRRDLNRNSLAGRVLDLDFHCPVCHAVTLFEGGTPWYSHQFVALTVSASR
jgi:hypothetical protein